MLIHFGTNNFAMCHCVQDQLRISLDRGTDVVVNVVQSGVVGVSNELR